MAAKTFGAKLDDDLQAQVLNRCQIKGCKPSDYLRDLIRKDIGAPENQTIAEGKVRRPTYVIDIPEDTPQGRISGAIIDGRRFKFCATCKKYYRKDENGKEEYWNP